MSVTFPAYVLHMKGLGLWFSSVENGDRQKAKRLANSYAQDYLIPHERPYKMYYIQTEEQFSVWIRTKGDVQ